MSPSDSRAADFVGAALGTFWVSFFAASVVADANLFPGVSERLRAIAKRGKDDDSKQDGASSHKSSGWHVPHKWFTHFYVVGVVCNGFVLVHAVGLVAELRSTGGREGSTSLITDEIESSARGALVAVLFQIHVTRRLCESLFLSKHNPHTKMHVVGYLVGMAYYVAAPLTLASGETIEKLCGVAMEAWESGMNAVVIRAASEQGIHQSIIAAHHTICAFLVTVVSAIHASTPRRLDLLINSGVNSTVTSSLSNLSSVFGTLVFAFGNLNQSWCHSQLAGLRKGQGAKGKGQGVKGAYKIPTGGWFTYVSCPHYFHEVVLYFGLAVVSGADTFYRLAPMLCAVVGNLWLTAQQTHVWYRKTFPKYPKERKAMVPGWGSSRDLE